MTSTGSYVDYFIGADVTFRPVTLGIAYTSNSITRAKYAYLLPNFASTKDCSSIAAGQIVFSISAAF